MKRVRVFLINGLILTITAFIMRFIGISFEVFISNKIGTEGMGVYQLVMSVYLFAITLASSGINLASTRIVSEDIACQNEQGAKHAMKKCILLSLIVGSLSCLILLLSSNIISLTLLHNKVSALPLKIMAISLPFISISAAINGYFSAVRRVIKTASSKILEQVIKIGITVIFLSILLPNNVNFSCIALVIGICISEICSFIYVYILYIFDKKKYMKNKKNNTSISASDYNKRIINITLPIALTSYIRSALSTLQQLLIPLRLQVSGLTYSSALSKYGLICGMTLPILLFPSVIIISFSNLLIPEISYYYAKKNYAQIKNITSRIFKSVFIFSICIFGIFLTFSNELSIIIYSNSQVGHFLKVLSPLVLVMYLDTIVDSILKGLDKQVSVMKCNIADLFVSIFCIYFFVPILGINGYVLSIYVSEFFNFCVSIITLLKITHVKMNAYIWFIKPLIGILSARFILRIFTLKTYTLIDLISHISIFIAIYILILILLGALKKKDFIF
ncbi:MAG: oligosaccharide flippase family protein [Clostridia bacterium]